MKRTIYLIPNIIAEDTQDQVINSQVLETVGELDYYLAENVRSARRFISSLKVRPVSELHFEKLDKNTSEKDLDWLTKPLQDGHSLGIISEAGCPAVADPGSLLIKWAHRMNVPVVPLVGPCSIILALMASGMNGQRFEFHGYLPIENADRTKTLRWMEKESRKRNKTQIFMETPYRNQKLMEAIIRSCDPSTILCIALDLTSPDQQIIAAPVEKWKRLKLSLNKKPAIFLIQAAAL